MAAYDVRSSIFIGRSDGTIIPAVQPGKAMTVQGDALTDRRLVMRAPFPLRCRIAIGVDRFLHTSAAIKMLNTISRPKLLACLVTPHAYRLSLA